MKYYKTLMNALSGAMPICMTWKLAGTEEGMNARDVYALALEEGGDNEELPEHDFYVVSAEGAIGMTTHYEYLTRWILIPVIGEEREKEMDRLRSELRFDQEMAASEAAGTQVQATANSQAEVQGASIPEADAMAQSQSPTHTMDQPGMRRFCASCGNPLNPGAKFCRNCGTKVML